MAWAQLTAQAWGAAGVTTMSSARRAGMVVVAYGKFGGIELSYSSDLDLVFLYD